MYDEDIKESLYANTADPYEDTNRRIDVENFIFSLSYKETVTVLFMALSYKPKEICKMLGYKDRNNIYQIIIGLKNKEGIKEF